MNGIEYIARILKQEGVEWISCYPSNPLIEAAAKESIRPIALQKAQRLNADGKTILIDVHTSMESKQSRF